VKSVKNKQDGFGIYELVVGIVIAVIFVGLVYVVFVRHTGSKTDKSSTLNTSSSGSSSSSSPYAVLSPASVASKAAECAQAITYSTNGSPTPIQCSNGDLNKTAWQALSALEPSVMGLGYAASVAQVQTAICNDANAADEDSSASTSNAIEMSVYQISKLYYGWDFSSDPSQVLQNGTC
jgi:hypothetical protein